MHYFAMLRASKQIADPGLSCEVQDAIAAAAEHATLIWSVFHDSYIVQPLPRIGALELKCTGTRDECNAWIAQQR